MKKCIETSFLHVLQCTSYINLLTVQSDVFSLFCDGGDPGQRVWFGLGKERCMHAEDQCSAVLVPVKVPCPCATNNIHSDLYTFRLTSLCRFFYIPVKTIKTFKMLSGKITMKEGFRLSKQRLTRKQMQPLLKFLNRHIW